VGAWYTPPAFARAVVRWAGIGEGDRVVDLGAGTGNLTRACLDAGARVTAVEIDAAVAPVLRANCPEAHRIIGDAFAVAGRWNLAILNPVWEGDMPERMLMHALTLAPRVVGIVPLNTLVGVDHYERLWRFARQTRELRCVRRPSFNGEGNGQRDVIAIEIERRGPGTVAGRDEDVVRVTYLERCS